MKGYFKNRIVDDKIIDLMEQLIEIRKITQDYDFLHDDKVIENLIELIDDFGNGFEKLKIILASLIKEANSSSEEIEVFGIEQNNGIRIN